MRIDELYIGNADECEADKMKKEIGIDDRSNLGEMTNLLIKKTSTIVAHTLLNRRFLESREKTLMHLMKIREKPC